MIHVLEDALLDSLKVFALVFILFFILGFIEKSINKKLNSNSKITPLFGAIFGLIPQCGISVAASDLYLKRRITLGTLMAVFIACSDEAIFILLSTNKIFSAFTLLFVKLMLGFILGILIDIFYSKKNKIIQEDTNIKCCHHNHHHLKSKNKIIDNLLHNLFHSLEVFIYVFIVNVIFGTIIYFVGYNNLILFLEQNKYLSPLFSALIGAIPNCASSIILTELFVIDGISFGALLAGLTINAGLGIVYLFKKKDHIKEGLLILLILFIISLIVGYLTCLVIGF